MAALETFAADCGLALERFQRRISKAAAGPEREFVALMPRGQGKTSLAALVALHHLITTEGAKVYCAASALHQARILFEYADARRLGHPNLVKRHLELRWCPDPDEPKVFTRHLRALPAEAPKLHGLTFSLAVLDELQAQRDDGVYTALASRLQKQPGAKLMIISTAAQGADSPLGKLRARALAQPSVTRRGAVTDARGPELRMLEWSVSESDDVDDPRIVKKANPASWISVEQLRAARQGLPDLAHRRYVANQWTERQGHWLPPGAWQACVGQPEFQPGEKLWVGCDVGGERSASAVAWLNEGLHAGCEIYEGEAAVFDCIDKIRELAAEYEVVRVVADPWRFNQASQELEREGMEVEKFPQNMTRMAPASDALHAAIVEKRLVLPDDPKLARHAADAIARHSQRGWRIDKPTADTHIDGIIALCMALDAVENQPEPVRLVGWL